MAKTYSKSDLAKKAKDVFKTYPTATVAFMTTDGYGFLDENRANLHAKSFKDGDYFEIENEDAVAVTKNDVVKKGAAAHVTKLTADELIEAAKDLDLDAAKKGLEVENARKKARVTVVAAYEERITELNTDK